MDEALLKAVEANRVALQQLVNQGADLREKHLKRRSRISTRWKTTSSHRHQEGRRSGRCAHQAWAPVLEENCRPRHASGAKAATTAEQFLGQMQTAMRDSRAPPA